MSEIELGDLTPRDIGRRVSVDGVSGMLMDFQVHTDWIPDWTYGNAAPTHTPGRQSMTVVVDTWTATGLSLDTPAMVDR